MAYLILLATIIVVGAAAVLIFDRRSRSFARPDESIDDFTRMRSALAHRRLGLVATPPTDEDGDDRRQVSNGS